MHQSPPGSLKSVSWHEPVPARSLIPWSLQSVSWHAPVPTRSLIPWSLQSWHAPVPTRGRGHDGLVNCVRTGVSESVSISKTFVAANAIYSQKFAGHDALASAIVATYEDSPVIFSVVAFPETDKTCKIIFSKSKPGQLDLTFGIVLP